MLIDQGAGLPAGLFVHMVLIKVIFRKETISGIH